MSRSMRIAKSENSFQQGEATIMGAISIMSLKIHSQFNFKCAVKRVPSSVEPH